MPWLKIINILLSFYRNIALCAKISRVYKPLQSCIIESDYCFFRFKRQFPEAWTSQVTRLKWRNGWWRTAPSPSGSTPTPCSSTWEAFRTRGSSFAPLPESIMESWLSDLVSDEINDVTNILWPSSKIVFLLSNYFTHLVWSQILFLSPLKKCYYTYCDYKKLSKIKLLVN